ncbi:unnamed protein product [Adineta ricciae]|uniref:RRM domain-containing protein n=1 Tax=Adineta ricciae TaxID=249248 RepID=A0A815MIQ8_ADIRI|nr:unnamed protein product [Adineta ricciae]
MSSILVDVPTFTLDQDDLRSIIKFIYDREHILKDFGAIKLQLGSDCNLATKKRRKTLKMPTKHHQCLIKNHDEHIYTVQKSSKAAEYSNMSSDSLDVATFWSSLASMTDGQRALNSSVIPGKSFFYQKASRQYFDIHRIPSQSLLRIGKKKVTDEITPCIRRAHQPNAIFPLSSTRQNLFTLDYHHEGGKRHWYVIPVRERSQVQSACGSHCIDHGGIFIDPSLLDQNHIRYHQIVQQPNEFVVLSAGTLAQSFTEDASWNESIDFALPSWINDGYANASLNLCRCRLSEEFLQPPIDTSLFRPTLISNYTGKHLIKANDDKFILSKDDNDLEMIILQTPKSLIDDSLNDDDDLSLPYEPNILLQELQSFIQTPIVSIETPALSTCASDEDQKQSPADDSQAYYEIMDQGRFPITLHTGQSEISFEDLMLNEQLLEIDGYANNSSYENLFLTSIFDDIASNCDTGSDGISYEELLETLPFVDEFIQMSSETSVPHPTDIMPINIEKSVDISQRIPESESMQRTLFVTGLKNNITRSQLKKCFPGCVKVVIKQSHEPPHLKYAFLTHRSAATAKHNLTRRLNRSLLGCNCRVSYSVHRSLLSVINQTLCDRKIVVTGIPRSVDESDLQRLFGPCHIEKYIPARETRPATSLTPPTERLKVLTGYAFLVYSTPQEAADILRHAGQYRLHGQSLQVSQYRY